MSDSVHDYTFDPGVLPLGVTIEVAEVAPAFGRPGGGMQVLFMKGTEPVDVLELTRRKVLR